MMGVLTVEIGTNERGACFARVEHGLPITVPRFTESGRRIYEHWTESKSKSLRQLEAHLKDDVFSKSNFSMFVVDLDLHSSRARMVKDKNNEKK